MRPLVYGGQLETSYMVYSDFTYLSEFFVYVFVHKQEQRIPWFKCKPLAQQPCNDKIIFMDTASVVQ